MARNRKTIIVTTSFPQASDSYAGIFVKKLVDALHNLRRGEFIVIVPYTGEAKDLACDYTVHGIRYFPRSFQRQIHTKGGLPAAIAKNRIYTVILPFLAFSLLIATFSRARAGDLIVANWSFSGFLAGLVARLRRCKTVTILRGTDVNSANSSLFAKTLLYLAVYLSDRIVCVSESLKESVCSIVPSAEIKITVIRNGIDFPESVYTRRVNCDSLNLICVGSITKNKNLSSVFRALKILKSKGIPFSLDVVGDGPELIDLKIRADLYGLENIKFHGQLDNRDVFEMLSKATVMINSSFSEGLSNSLLEASVSGCLLVASDIPGNRMLVQHMENGLMFHPDSELELADRLQWVYSNPAFATELALKCHEFCLSEVYDWRECAVRYSNLINDLDVVA